MNGIKDLLILYYWMNNNKAPANQQPLFDRQQHIPKDRQIILNELEKEAKPPGGLFTTTNQWK